MKRMMSIATVALCTLAAGSASAETSMTCASVDKRDIAALFDRWNASLATHDPAKVTANYAPEAVLLATVSNRPRTTPAEIEDYFVHFLEKNPKGTIDTRTIRIGCNTASDVGTYTFELKDNNGDVMKVPARYSFIYELHDGKWLIVHHHSSAMPEPVK